MQPQTSIIKQNMRLGGMQRPDHAWSLGHRRGLHFIPRALSAAPRGCEAAGDIWIAFGTFVGHFYIDHFTKTSYYFYVAESGFYAIKPSI